MNSVLVEAGALDKIQDWIGVNYTIIVIISDERVGELYGQKLLKQLKKKLPKAQQVFMITIPVGEKSKNARAKQAIETQMFAHACGRDTLILALGGGVVGDLAGFVAATYMRGIDYIQLPTTLLAMVDSSIGGKTAINTPYGKNLIGAFWSPKAVIVDLACLKSLEAKQLINGFVEMLKVFLIQDAKSVYNAKQDLAKILAGDNEVLKKYILKAIELKSKIVHQDQTEKNKRAILNFGHTIGHALEQYTNYKLMHGFAVGYGILLESKISEILGLISFEAFSFIEDFLSLLNIKANYFKKIDLDKVIFYTRSDKKNKAGKVNYVLLASIGKVYSKEVDAKKVYAHNVSEAVVRKAIAAMLI